MYLLFIITRKLLQEINDQCDEKCNNDLKSIYEFGLTHLRELRKDKIML